MNSKPLEKQRNSYLLDFLLYSFLGCVSYLLLVYYADIPVRHQERLVNPEAIFAVIILFNGAGISMRYVNRKISQAYPVFLRQHNTILLFLMVTAVALFISDYLLLVSAKMVIGLKTPFKVELKGGAWLLGIWLTQLIIVSQFMVNQFYKNLIRLYRRSQELEETNLRAQYTALQSQLNPHFLFNSLNTLISEIEYDPKNAVKFTRYLADTYRYILLCQDKRSVSLEEEMKFMDTYVRIQNVRLGDCLHLDICIDKELLHRTLPPLTLQLLIENVIKHNTVSFGKPMKVSISAKGNPGEEWLCVSNPVHPKQGVMASGKGLTNLSLRYRLLCSQDIVIDDTPVLFTVKVPLLYD